MFQIKKGNIADIKQAALIVKVVSSCNLACRYCDADIYSNQRMRYDTLYTLIEKTLRSFDSVNFIWHGGEPLSLGLDFYKKVMAIEDELVDKRHSVRNSLQTNGTLLNNEWLEFFDKNKFSFGISFDGSETIHDKNRVFKNGKGSHSNVTNAIRLIQEKHMNVGIIAVVTEETVKLNPEEFLGFFLDNGIKNISLNWERPRFNLNEVNGLERDKYSEFINKLFDVWYKKCSLEVNIREFRSIMNALAGGRSNFCILAGECIGKYFGISPDGDVYHCDEFMFDDNYKLGNIAIHDFKDILISEKIKLLSSRNQGQIEKLRCKWINVCNGGCPKDRYVMGRYGHGTTHLYCCGWSKIIEHIANEISVEIRRYG